MAANFWLENLFKDGRVRMNKELKSILNQKTVLVSRLKKVIYPLLNELSRLERQNKKKDTRISKLLEERKQLHRKIRNQKEELRR